MIGHLKTLKPEFQGKKLFICDTGKRALWLFSYLAYRGEDIAGFVDPRDRDTGTLILNRPVVSLSQFAAAEDAVLVIDGHGNPWSAERIARMIGDLPGFSGTSVPPVLRLDDLLGRNPLVAAGVRPVYLYGTAGGAWSYLKQLERDGLPRPAGFLQTDAGILKEILGVPVIPADKAELGPEAVIIVTALSGTSIRQILTHLEKLGFCGDVLIEEVIGYMDLWGTDPFPLLQKSIREERRVLVCSEDPLMDPVLDRIFELYGISVSRKVSLDGDPGRGLDDIYSLADEDPDSSVLLIQSFDDIKRLKIVEAANDLGFSPGSHNYAGIHKTSYNRARTTKVLDYEDDQGINNKGVSIDFSPIGGIPGWAVRGEEAGADVRIMVLGGSTSSELYYPENWIAKLFRRLKREGIRAVIWNGAHEMEGAMAEMIRMSRDIHALKPDLVISMSGVNDQIGQNGKFDRLKHETPFRTWRRYEGYMDAVCRAEGARFFPFLQPINMEEPEPTEDERLFFRHDPGNGTRSFGREAEESVREDGFFTNLFDAFRHRGELFLDCCHYSDKGQQCLADLVYDTIRETIHETTRKAAQKAAQKAAHEGKGQVR